MDTGINTSADQIDADLKDTNQRLAVRLQEKLSAAMLDLARKGGIVPNTQLRHMVAEFAAAGADAVMGELGVVQSKMRLPQDDLPPELRGATTQEIVTAYVAPKMTASIASAAMNAGFISTRLWMPAAGDPVPVFTGSMHAIRVPGSPADRMQAPQLTYGTARVTPRASGFAPLKQLGRDPGDV